MPIFVQYKAKHWRVFQTLNADNDTLRQKVQELQDGFNNDTTNDYIHESSFLPTPETESDYE